MYVKRGMKEIVCLKMEMGLREEEKREFDEFVLLCLRLGGGGECFFFNYLFIYRGLVLGRRKFLVLGFEVFIFFIFYYYF